MDYMKDGEKWENDPQAYVDAFTAFGRGNASAALDEVDPAEMLASWATETLRDVVESGTDLAFNKRQRRKINKAALKLWNEREPAVVPDGNGMGEDGAQA